jgi:sec-independent protein translocase protein TatB
MFEIGWTEMLVIAVVMIVVVGPKDLPKMLRTFGKTTAKLRSMAGDFQKQFNEALKEAELDDVKKSVDSLRGMNPAAQIKKQLNPFEKAAADVRAGVDAAMKPKPAAPADPAASVATAAEPLKNGAAAMPGEVAASAPHAPVAAPSTPAPAAVAATVGPTGAAEAAAPKAAKPRATKKTAEATGAAKPKAARAKKKTESSAT